MEVKSMRDLVLVKKDMVRYVQDMKAVRGMGRGLSNHHAYKVRLVGTLIKRRVIVDGARRIRSEKLKKHQCREGYARSLEGKRSDGENNVDHMWEQME